MFHVFVEGAKDATPEGIRKVGEAIAARYGLRAADLIGRMSKGRVRVKGNVDRATADQYVRDLQALGARVSIEPATPASSRVTPQPMPAVKPPAAKPPAGYQSGLAAAFSAEQPAAGLGALDGSAFSLVSVDGAEEAAPEPPPAQSFAPPPAAEPKAAKKPKPKDEPVDLFLPPDAAGEAELKVDLAPEEIKKPPAPPPVVAAPATLAAAPAAFADAEPRSSPLALLAGPRPRFAAGIVLAIVLGFIPAHLVARMREHSAYAEIDRKADALGKAADTPEAYEGLDNERAVLLDHKYSERRSIALLALAVWAACGGAIAYAWIRRWPTLG